MLKKLLSYGLSMSILMSNLCFNSLPTMGADKLVAFPGAEGGGMYSQGARAADSMSIYHVTNLNDSGAGSFRDALSQGNRIIVFDVAGTVMLKSDLKSSESNITILGQTAPGEGICIGGASVQFSGGSNIIVRYMRFRSGDYSGSQEDCVGVRKCTDIIFDHCSITWSVDECLSAYENKNFTAQYCIISESLNNSIHGKGEHGYGGIWGGINASFHHNLISSHNSRNPRIGTSYTVHSYNDTPDYESLVDIRNNVFYNWGMNSGYGGENNIRVNFVNNYYKPSTKSKVQRIYEHYAGTGNAGTTLHLSGNVMEGNNAVTEDNWLGVSAFIDGIVWTKCESISDGYTDSTGTLWANNQYINDYPITTQTAEATYNSILDNVGASYVRDDIDKRIVDDARKGTMPTGSKTGLGLIDTQEDVGGWSSLYGTKANDSDNDGIPDNWEDNNGLDKNNSKDSLEISATGYTYIEEYANYLADEPVYELDKAALKGAISKAQAIDRTHYGSTDFTPLDNAIEQGIALLASRTATQEQLDKCAKDILSILSTFSEDIGYKLIEAIATAEKINKWDYTSDSYRVLEEAIADADNVLKSAYTEENINSAIEKINTAAVGLEKSLRRNLKSILRKCKGVADTGYYTYSWNKLQKEISAAEKLYNDFYVDENTYQSSIDKLNIAYSNLKGNFKEIVKVNETFENGSKGIFKDSYSCIVELLNDKYDNEGGFCNLIKKYPSDFAGSINTKIPSSVDAICSGSSVIVSQDICFTEELPTSSTLLTLTIYDSTISKYHTDNKFYIGTMGGNFCASFKAKEYSSIKVEQNKWYNLSIFFNNENKTVSYYIDGQPILENMSIPSDWGTDFYNYFTIALAGKHANVLVDNFTVIERQYDKQHGGQSFIYGDADCSGGLTSNDAAYVLHKVIDNNFVMPVEEKTLNYMNVVDVDYDGVLSSADAALILQKVLNDDAMFPVETASTTTVSTTTTTETTTETTTTTTTETTTETTTSKIYVLQYELNFEDLNDSADSPYKKDIFTVENSSGKIDAVDVDIFDYKKAVVLDGNTITIDAPRTMEFEMIARTTGDTEARLKFPDGGMVLISPGEDTIVKLGVVPGGSSFTISGNGAYIAALKLYDVIDPNTTTESTSESTTETTTETTTKTTTESTTCAMEFDFSGLEKGKHTTDYTNSVFSLIADEGGYSVGGDDEKYITLDSPEDSPNPSVGYILIDASAMPNGFTLSLDAILQGYTYCRLTLANEAGETVDEGYVSDNYEKRLVSMNAYSGGKYALKVTGGLPMRIYRLGITEKS